MNIQVTTPYPRSRPVWAERAPYWDSEPELTAHIPADAVVVGAGFTGLRAALELVEGGASVVVLDASSVAAGASGRSGGQVNPMLPFNGPDQLRRILGPTYFERLAEASLNSADSLFEFVRKYGISCEARQNGWLRVCHNRRALKQAKSGVAAWNAFGASMQVLEGAELKRLAGTSAYQAGVLAPKGGAIHPQMLAFGMAEAARQRGVRLFGKSAVEDLQRTGGGWTVITRHGQIETDWVVIATNGYTGELIPKLSRTILPLVPVQIATEPQPPDRIADILPEGHTISDSRRVIMYARREPDHRIVYGGLGRMNADGTLSGFDWLVKDALRVYPQLSDAIWTHFWGGRIAITEDHLPHLHEPRPGIVVGLGYNGRGVAMTQLMGRSLAERVLGAPSESLVFPVTDIKTIRGRSLQLKGMRAVVGLMRLLDYLETR